MTEPSSLLELVEIIGRLRRECAWKAEQTHESLARFLIEESFETVEAIEAGDAEELRDELGDVLLQVYLHAAIAAETGAFDIEDVAAGLAAKMLRRNPHVFGDAPQSDANVINAVWQAIKAEEKPGAELMEGVPLALPALLRAHKLLDRSARAGRPVVVDADSDDIGERLLSLVAEAHEAGVDPEQALRAACRRRTPSPAPPPTPSR